MPSPIGHSLAGLSVFILMRRLSSVQSEGWLLLGSVFLANIPDLDILAGLLVGDPRTFHRGGTHSLTAAAVTGLGIALVSGRWQANRIAWALWAAGLYASHVLLDLLVDDPVPPFGSQLFWPFSREYFISPCRPLAAFHYFDPALGMMRTIFSPQNLQVAVRETAFLLPFLGLTWYLANSSSKRRVKRKSF